MNNYQSIITQQLHKILSGPEYPEREFVLSKYTYAAIYALAGKILHSISELNAETETICLCAEDKGIVAAAVLACFAGKMTLVLPYACSEHAIMETCEAVGSTKAITDNPEILPDEISAVPLNSTPFVCKDRGLDGEFKMTRNPNAACLRLFTGGSTGKPKAWNKTPINIFAEALFHARKQNLSFEDRIVSTAPPYHIFGLYWSALVPFITSASVAPSIYTLPNEILSALNTYRATVFVGTPIHYRALNGRDIPSDFLRVGLSSAGILDEADEAYFFQKTGAGIEDFYGSTETGIVASRCRSKGEHAFIPFETVEWKIKDCGIAVRSIFVCPELLESTDGFFMIGDRVTPCENNRFTLLGRADSVVKVAGNRVDLDAVRDKLKQIPGIKDAVVIALPEIKRENEIVAVVEGYINDGKIKKYMSELLESYAIPRRIRVVDKIPVRQTGKYDRSAIERMFNHGT